MAPTSICPFCFRNNEPDADQCVHCGVALKSSRTGSFSTQRVAKRQSAILADRARCLNLPPDMVEGDVALFVADAEEPIIIRQGTQTTLGRYGDDSPEPLIDLSPYGAINQGVSRHHALLTVNENQTTLMDLNSTNGSWINQEQAISGKSFALRNGDRILLARLLILVCIYSGEHAQEAALRFQSMSANAGLTPQFLATAVVPFLDRLAELQAILSGGQGQTMAEAQILSITALPDADPITIHLIGVAEAARLARKWLMPWKIVMCEKESPIDPNSGSIREELVRIGQKLLEETAVAADPAKTEEILPILSALLANPLILLPD